ncbi:MAG TPA: sensor histidine kinase [Caulobacteraceae bacterium]|nr:sensor histidine kinase [Caulobacteraceae bacterium]
MAPDVTPPTPAADSLGLAILACSEAPLLLLDDDLSLIAASASFHRAFQTEAAEADGHPVFAIGDGEWDVPQLRSLLRATLFGAAEIDAYEMDLMRPGHGPRRLILKAHKLDYAPAGKARLLLSVSDVTDARLAERLKDDLLREKAILVQELQHRVANSLQIIASVLLMSARRVQSQETRDHLYDAHKRVMSVAALQQHLAASTIGDVALRRYFTELCETIGASMIHDPERLRLVVNAGEAEASADVSVSLGLIVTELVINALKHAFPDGRHGEIRVGYEHKGPDWTLRVADDGVGMPMDLASAKVGLGTSIVEALAKTLDARVVHTQCDPGTAVSIIHEGDSPPRRPGPNLPPDSIQGTAAGLGRCRIASRP